MRGFLHAMQVDYMRLPATLDEQAGMYRSLLAGKRMLVVLDNVLDADQVRPLLPGSPGCLVIVTSRSQLVGLVTLNGARLINLDVLSEPEAGDLFAARLGANRTAAESGAVGELARFCACLPLALCITAARAAIHPEMPLSALAAELKNAGSPLDALDSAEPGADIRTVFSWSYNNLGSDASRMFRLLSLHPGPDLGIPAAASLAGRPMAAARTALRDLANAGLLTEHAPGRYALHDLLRTYASEQVCRAETDAERGRAMSRVLDHYLHSARAADETLYPARWSVIFDQRVAHTVTEEFAGKEQAYAWFDAERLILLKLIEQAAGSGFDAYSWRLAWIIRRYLNARGYPNEMLATQATALGAACRAGDLEGQAHIHLSLGRARTELGDYAAAGENLGKAFDIFRQCGHHVGEAYAILAMGHNMERQQRYPEALSFACRAIGLSEAFADDPEMELVRLSSLNNAGWLYACTGRLHEARSHSEEALQLYRQVGYSDGTAAALDSLGFIYTQLGDYAKAIACFHEALDLLAALGNRYKAAEASEHLAEAYLATGDLTRARAALSDTLAILDGLHHPYAGADPR